MVAQGKDRFPEKSPKRSPLWLLKWGCMLCQTACQQHYCTVKLGNIVFKLVVERDGIKLCKK